MPKVAILIDGGYFLKRLPRVRRGIDVSDPSAVGNAIRQLVRSHLDQLNKIYETPNFYRLLYRCFFYDAYPYKNKAHSPIEKRAIDYSNLSQPVVRLSTPTTQLCSETGRGKETGRCFMDTETHATKETHQGRNTGVGPHRFGLVPNLRQKGVDMRIGLDIASLTLKKQVDLIVLVSGDSDFVSAAKLARREGVQFILDPLWQNVSPELLEHIDGLTSGFANPSDANG